MTVDYRSRDRLLVQPQRDKTYLALRVGDEQQRRLAAIGLQRLGLLDHVLGRRDRLLIDLDNHVAGRQAPFSGDGIGINLADQRARP